MGIQPVSSILQASGQLFVFRFVIQVSVLISSHDGQKRKKEKTDFDHGVLPQYKP